MVQENLFKGSIWDNKFSGFYNLKSSEKYLKQTVASYFKIKFGSLLKFQKLFFTVVIILVKYVIYVIGQILSW